MLIRSYEEAEASGRVISISHGMSTAVRVLLKSDGLGFSLSEARCGANNQSKLWYKNHWEANYIRAGKGMLINRCSGETWELCPGVLYCVGPADQHSVSNTDDPLRIVSIFNPPIEGSESHDEDGAYPPTGEIPPGKDRMFVRTQDEVRAMGNEKVLGNGKIISLRMLTAADRLGFSLSDVRIKANTVLDLWYKYHWEANQVLHGCLQVTDLNLNDKHTLKAGDVYCVGPSDKHRLSTQTGVHLLSIFNPPLSGQETHDQDGSYPPDGQIPAGLE